MNIASDNVVKKLKEFTILEYFSIYTLLTIGACILAICIGKTGLLNEVGTFISGMGTFGLFMIALFQVPAAIDQYNQQRKRDKIAEFSYDLTDKCLKFIDALRSLTSPLVMTYESVNPDTGEKEDGQIANFRNMYNYRFNLIRGELQNYYENSWKAVAIDDEELSECLKALEKAWRELRATALTILTFSDNSYDSKSSRTFFNQWYDIDSVRKIELERLEKEIVRILKKYY